MKRLVLVGAGHAHARVLRDIAQRRPSAVEVVLVSPEALAPYSGMVPGWLAGHYQWRESCIDFASLCKRAGAKLYTQAVTALDPCACELRLDNGEMLRYDWLSLNIGSTLTPPTGRARAVLPMRPLGMLQARWDGLLASVRQLPAGSTFHVAMVGGGAAGVETVLSAHHRLRLAAPQVDFRFSLVTRSPAILAGLPAAAVRHAQAHLDACGIALIGGFAAGAVDERGLHSADGRVHPADAFLWATGAQALDWPRDAGVATDDKGFIRVDATLRSLSHPNIFAAGDCARLESDLPKAGVFAVRMGPILAHNLLAALQAEPLRQYVAQRRYLMIIGTGATHAIASWGALSCQGAWVWRVKQRIDRRFIASYNDPA